MTHLYQQTYFSWPTDLFTLAIVCCCSHCSNLHRLGKQNQSKAKLVTAMFYTNYISEYFIYPSIILTGSLFSVPRNSKLVEHTALENFNELSLHHLLAQGYKVISSIADYYRHRLMLSHCMNQLLFLCRQLIWCHASDYL